MKILLLPYSQYRNPYQLILLNKLREEQHNVTHGLHYKAFAICMNSFRNKPEVIIIDWFHQWYLKKSRLITYIRMVIMLMDYFIACKILRLRVIQNIHNLEHHDHKYHHKLQGFVLQKVISIVSDVRFFSQGQLKKTLSELNITISDSKIWVMDEENKCKYYREKRSGHSLKLNLHKERANYLLFGNDRENKCLSVFLEQNFTKQSDTSYYYTDPLLQQVVTPSQMAEERNISLIQVDGRDRYVDLLFQSMNAILLPYRSEILNSGIFSLARDYRLPVIGRRFLGDVYETEILSSTPFEVEGEALFLFGHLQTKHRLQNWNQILNR